MLYSKCFLQYKHTSPRCGLVVAQNKPWKAATTIFCFSTKLKSPPIGHKIWVGLPWFGPWPVHLSSMEAPKLLIKWGNLCFRNPSSCMQLSVTKYKYKRTVKVEADLHRERRKLKKKGITWKIYRKASCGSLWSFEWGVWGPTNLREKM